MPKKGEVLPSDRAVLKGRVLFWEGIGVHSFVAVGRYTSPMVSTQFDELAGER